MDHGTASPSGSAAEAEGRACVARNAWRQVKACLRPRCGRAIPSVLRRRPTRPALFGRLAQTAVVCNSRDPVPRAVGVVFDVYIQVPERERAGIAASQNNAFGQNSN